MQIIQNTISPTTQLYAIFPRMHMQIIKIPNIIIR